MPELLLLASLVFVAALLYASVGHGGASGYLAAMGLVGVAAAVMKPTALVLNVLVSAIATVQFLRVGAFSWPVFWPFALGSIPLAFVGGAVALPSTSYKRLVGVVLLYAAWRLVVRGLRPGPATHPPSAGVAIGLGAAIGLLSGLVGVGGGIFLSPLVLFMGWAAMRETAGVAALFILVNSLAGLTGHLASLALLPPETPVLAAAAVAGGAIGATAGARRLATPALRRLLGVVLAIAGAKMLLGR